MKAKLDRGTLLVVISAVAVAAAYVTLVCLPLRRQIRQLDGELADKQEYLARMGEVGTIIQTTQKELDRANAYNSAWHECSPNDNELAELFGQISALAKTAGTVTTRFDPEPIVTYGRIRKIPLTMGCRGSFAQVYKFLAELEGLPETIWVVRADLEEIPQNGKDIQCQVSLVIFADKSDNSDQVDRSG